MPDNPDLLSRPSRHASRIPHLTSDTPALETQALRAFLAVAESGSFSQAGEALHLTQPAVSKRIATLESQLDCRLFDRVSGRAGRKASLTEAGRALLPAARRILQDVEDAVRSIRELRGQVAGILSLGISHHIGLHRLPPLLKAYTQRYPEVTLDIAFLDSEQAYSQVLQGQRDLGVITLAPDNQPPLEQFVVWRDELVIAVAPGHPLAAKDPIDLATLSAHRAILPGLNTYTGQIITHLFQQHDLPLEAAMSTHYLESLKMLVSIGLGWGVLPRTLLDDSVRDLTLRGQSLGRELGCVFHRDRHLSNAAAAFIALLREEAGG
ncbi:MAG TPA: LysR family transcriptional regulator [Spongiibacteraceae bacterium]|jgi:DNA-binding transcriptional LysR family regulator|nr:LysR family transcriptional regulator [Spongiibacteraceae bacterium]HUH37389.1 LysR family transcriptional regulator [Spongiibacteraceae bacterium]